MKFIVSRKRISVTENRKPCDEAIEEELTPLDYRTVKTLEEAKKRSGTRIGLKAVKITEKKAG